MKQIPMKIMVFRFNVDEDTKLCKILSSILFRGIIQHSVILFVFGVFAILLQTWFVSASLSLLCYLFSLSVEESYHLYTALKLRKSKAFDGITLRVFFIKKIPVFCYSASVRFVKENISPIETSQVALGGALMSFVVSSIIFFFLVVFQISRMYVIISLFFLPIQSLLPTNILGYKSDGLVFYSQLRKQARPFQFFIDSVRLIVCSKRETESDE